MPRDDGTMRRGEAEELANAEVEGESEGAPLAVADESVLLLREICATLHDIAIKLTAPVQVAAFSPQPPTPTQPTDA